MVEVLAVEEVREVEGEVEPQRMEAEEVLEVQEGEVVALLRQLGRYQFLLND